MPITLGDMMKSLEGTRKEQAEEIGAPDIPKVLVLFSYCYDGLQVLWSDIGGLADAKRDILETIQV